MSDVKRVAVLGLGIIGSRVCARLVQAGLEVACWNRTPKGMHGETSDPASAVKDAEVISIYLKDAPTVREIYSKVADHLMSGQIVLNHATIDVETTHWLAQQCEARGCKFLDAPFTGSRVAAESGGLSYYIGGDKMLAGEVDGFLTLSSKARLYCGGMGTATVVKLATNLVSACTVQALAEALGIVMSQGVPAECLVKAIEQNANASVLTGMKLPKMVAADFDAHFSLSNMAKDSRYMVALAEQSGLEVPAITAVAQRMTDLSDSGLADLDFCSVAKPYLP